MKIKIAHHEHDAAYLRYARTETLKAVNINPTPAIVEPHAFATYLVAYDERTGQPVGMGESAMMTDAYGGSYENTPYRSVCDLNDYCPPSQMAGMRTVYVEPEYRTNSSVFLALTLGSAQLFYQLGARYATASTRGSDTYLNRLYAKWGGDRVGTFRTDMTEEPSSLFVFDLKKMLSHRATQRVTRYVSFEFSDQLAAV